MRLKLDENLSGDFLKRELEYREHDVETVADEKLLGHSDLDVFNAAQSEERLLLTTDHDLRRIGCAYNGKHAGVVLFKPTRPRQADLLNFVVDFVTTASLEDFSGAVVEVKPSGHRILKLCTEK